MYTSIDKDEIFNKIGIESVVNMLYKEVNDNLNGKFLKYARETDLEEKDVYLSSMKVVPLGSPPTSSGIKYLVVEMNMEGCEVYIVIVQRTSFMNGKRYGINTGSLDYSNEFYKNLSVADQCFVIKRMIEELKEQFELRYIIGEV